MPSNVGDPVLIRDHRAGVVVGRYEGCLGPDVCDITHSRKIWSWSGDKLDVTDVANTPLHPDYRISRTQELTRRVHTNCETLVLTEEQYALFMTATPHMEK